MLKDQIYKILPNFLQNALITFYDYTQYKKRHGETYHAFKSFLKKNEFRSKDEIDTLQNEGLVRFLKFCKENSPYYKEILKNIDVEKGLEILDQIPICSKETFRANIPKLISGKKSEMFKSKTGGTTGSSMQVYYRWDDAQERFAFLDNFRERFGYKFGEKTAWFSGKDILTDSDLRKNRFWKQDFLYNIRYYSTFNINKESLIHYINDIKEYQPRFIVGFPSSLVEIARYGLRHNIDLGYKVEAIFPTAESKEEKEAADMTAFFGGGVHDQYASSEGACFITECESGKLHIEPLSGVIEVVDDNNQPAQEGKILITAFQTRGTPLIRYDIGDRVRLSEEQSCSCGRHYPIVEEIQGRINDFIYSRERGKCNLGNVSNCIKYVKGVRKFQVIQDSLDAITVLVDKTEEYGDKDEKVFREELVYRLGDKIQIDFEYVDDIPKEKSGKYRIVKNSIQHLISLTD